jgi:sortase B
MKKICYTLFIISAVNILLVSCASGFVATLQSEIAKATPTEMAAATTTANKTTEETTELPEIADESEDLIIFEVHPRFEELLLINPDVAGQVIIEGTNINYPVVFGRDNAHYFNHDVYGNENIHGAIFMDMSNRGAILDDNTVLHGNNFLWQNNSMFTDLELFKNWEFFNSNRIITFNNLYSDMEWEIFAVCVIHANDYYMIVRFGTHENYLDYLEHIRSQALFFTDFEPEADDKLLTLHTYTFDFTGAHLLVHARLINRTDNIRGAVLQN